MGTKIKNFMALSILLTQDHMGLEIYKKTATPTAVFIQWQLNFMTTFATMGGIQAIAFLGKRPSFKSFVAL